MQIKRCYSDYASSSDFLHESEPIFYEDAVSEPPLQLPRRDFLENAQEREILPLSEEAIFPERVSSVDTSDMPIDPYTYLFNKVVAPTEDCVFEHFDLSKAPLIQGLAAHIIPNSPQGISNLLENSFLDIGYESVDETLMEEGDIS